MNGRNELKLQLFLTVTPEAIFSKIVRLLVEPERFWHRATSILWLRCPVAPAQTVIPKNLNSTR